jgi:hypothetical protein
MTSVPNPIDGLLPFIDVLWQCRDTLKPTRPEHCLPFISIFCPTPALDFFAFDFPKAIGNPILGIETCCFLNETHHPLWISFTDQTGSVERLLDLFVPFLTPLVGRFDRRFWTFRLELCDLLCSLIVAKFETLQLALDFAATLNRNITALIADSPPEFAADFLRYSLQINRIWLPLLPPNTAEKRLLNLLSAAPSGTVAHEAIVRFAVFWSSCEIITCESIATELIGHELTRTSDLELLGFLATRPNSNAVSVVVRYLSRVAILDPIYARAAGTVLLSVLKKVRGDRPVTQWMNHFIRRLTIFVSLAFAKNRYHGRIARIAELLGNPDLRSVDWIGQIVEPNVSALWRTNGAPHYWGDVFIVAADGELSEKWKLEVDEYRAAKPNLKTFPFEATGTNLCEVESQKPKVKKKKWKKKPKEPAEKQDVERKPSAAEAPPKKKGRKPKWQP